MTETRKAAIEALFVKWEHNARHYDDYRGILMCMKDLRAALDMTETPLPDQLHKLLQRADAHLASMKGRPYAMAGDPTELIQQLRTAVDALATNAVKVEDELTRRTQAAAKVLNERLVAENAELKRQLAMLDETVTTK
jgi:hypothetical protein